MKLSVTKPKQEFKPIALCFSVETKRELELLLTIFNASYDSISKLANKSVNDFGIAPFDPSEAAISELQAQYSIIEKEFRTF